MIRAFARGFVYTAVALVMIAVVGGIGLTIATAVIIRGDSADGI